MKTNRREETARPSEPLSKHIAPPENSLAGRVDYIVRCRKLLENFRPDYPTQFLITRLVVTAKAGTHEELLELHKQLDKAPITSGLPRYLQNLPHTESSRNEYVKEWEEILTVFKPEERIASIVKRLMVAAKLGSPKDLVLLSHHLADALN